MEERFCPCCGRRCSLDNPHCERGEAYARSTVNNSAVEKSGTEKAFDVKKVYEGSDVNNKLIWNIRDVGHTLRALYDKESQSRILIILNERGAITQCELTERLGIRSGSASEVIGKLEKSELITREASAEDRRTSEIRLTELGKQKAAEAARQREERHSEMFECLSTDEKNTLLALLERLNGDWRGRYCTRSNFNGDGCDDRNGGHRCNGHHGHGCGSGQGHGHEHGRDGRGGHCGHRMED